MGVLQDNLVLSTGLIMGIGHRKEIQKLTFRVLALCRSDLAFGLESQKVKIKIKINQTISKRMKTKVRRKTGPADQF